MMYEQQRALYIAYLTMKVAEADWHGVSDAANDLRELEAEYKILTRMNPNVPQNTPAQNLVSETFDSPAYRAREARENHVTVPTACHSGAASP